MPHKDRLNAYTQRVEEALERSLPDAKLPPTELHEAMRYSVRIGCRMMILLMSLNSFQSSSLHHVTEQGTALESRDI